MERGALSGSTEAIRSAPSERLTSTTAKGLRWTLLGTVATFAAQSVYSAVMSRLLVPSDFGLLALAMFVLRFVSYFGQGGLSSAVVQRPVLGPREIRATFTLGITAGLVSYAILWLLAPFAIDVLGAPAGLTPVCRVLGLTLVISALASTATGLLRRSMRYRTISLIEFGSYLVGYCGIGVTSAVAGSGVWSLVHAAIGQAGVMTLWSYASTRHDLRPLCDRQAMRSVSSFGAKVSFLGFLEFLTISIDNVLVSRYAGIEALGQYNRAMLIAMLPLHQIAAAVTKVLFPAFSRIQLQPERLRSAYLDSMAVTSMLFLPMAAVIGAGADNYVLILLGGGWHTAAQLVPILAAAGALHVVVYCPASMAEAIGRVRQKAAIEVVHLATLLLGTGVVVVFKGGLFELVGAVLVSRMVQHALYLVWMDRVIPRSLRPVLNAYGQAVVVAVGIGLADSGVGHAVAEVAPVPVVLTVQLITVGLAAIAGLRCGRFLKGMRVARQRALIPASLVSRFRRAVACE
ncbi:lipopolysaccharide biosynthesis protein [Streptomyces sp. MK5]|uniref:lipopolysaccharide biosynthesis protein n=1 Tax=Streptomyces sp. MK5 TaxID=3064253 RepID=UPI0027408D19|nr:lipopolysaccharide biosynthesis protein [Streptomyces sp. MK5]